MRLRTIPVSVIAALACLPLSALAVDGVTLIDQNKALAGNVTPGDEAGFPVTLSRPGSYRLSGNLTVPAGVNGFLIASPGVTLDLNGFTLSSEGRGGVNPRAVTAGDSTNQPQAAFRNGRVTGFNTAIYMEHSTGVVVEDMRIGGMGTNGMAINVGANSRVQRNVIDGDGYIVTACPGLVLENITALSISHKTDTLPYCLDDRNRANNRTYQLLQ